MRPKKHETTEEEDLFRARLDQIIDMKHELVQLAGRLDWDWLDGEIAPLYSDKGRPGIETRFVIGLLLLKHIFALSDEEVCERWVYDPYFQYFTGEEFFQHAFPHERSDLSHWRKRLGDKLELLLAESLRVAHEAGALRTRDLKRVTVDTTVQPKAITFPTDAKLLHAAIQGLNRLARKYGNTAATVLSAHRQAGRDDGGARRPRQAVQPASPPVAPPAHSARSDHPRYPPQDRRQD
jgi:IS5 family transposase